MNPSDLNLILLGVAAVLGAGAQFGRMLRSWRRDSHPLVTRLTGLTGSMMTDQSAYTALGGGHHGPAVSRAGQPQPALVRAARLAARGEHADVPRVVEHRPALETGLRNPVPGLTCVATSCAPSQQLASYRHLTSLIEHGTHGVDVVRLLRLAAALDVPLGELLGATDGRPG